MERSLQSGPLVDDRTTGLSRPLWWCALLALVANDHLLKGAHLLPNAVTGKLSDVAGLIVAPVLAAALLRGGTRRRALAFALVVVPFAAINVSTDAARGAEALMAALGMHWRIWTDPTDLAALVVLPFAWRLCEPRRVAIDLRRPAIVLGSVACVATSMPIGPETQGFIVNHTGSPVTVRVRVLEADLDCDAVEERVADALSRDLFGEGTTYVIQANEVLPIGAGAFNPACDAALLNIDGLSETIAFWNDIPAREIETRLAETEEIRAGGIRLTWSGSGIETNDVTLVEARARVPGTCASGPAYGWSTPSTIESTSSWTLLASESTVDGCLRAELESELGHIETLFVCLPEWAFPFEVGETLMLGGAEGRLYVESHRAELRVEQMEENTRYFGYRARLEPGECGARTACGAFVMSSQVTVADEPLTPERSVELVDGNERVTFGVGRAEHILAASPECEPSRTIAREYAEIVVLREELE